MTILANTSYATPYTTLITNLILERDDREPHYKISLFASTLPQRDTYNADSRPVTFHVRDLIEIETTVLSTINKGLGVLPEQQRFLDDCKNAVIEKNNEKHMFMRSYTDPEFIKNYLDYVARLLDAKSTFPLLPDGGPKDTVHLRKLDEYSWEMAKHGSYNSPNPIVVTDTMEKALLTDPRFKVTIKPSEYNQSQMEHHLAEYIIEAASKK